MSAELPPLDSEIEALRAVKGRSEAKENVLRALALPRRTTIVRIYRTGLGVAGVAAAILAGVVLLVPRPANASVKNVVKALSKVRHYHIKSFSNEPGLGPRFEGETWVNGGVHRTVLYDQNRKAMPRSIVQDLEKAIWDQRAKDYTQNMEETFWGATRQLQPTDFKGKKIAMGELLPDGKMRTVQVWGISHPGNGTQPAFVLYSCFSSVTMLSKFMEDESLWHIQRGVVMEGRTLDKYVMKGFEDKFNVYVDPNTNLPLILKIQWATDYYTYDNGP